MQVSVPELMDLRQGSEQTLAAYGAEPGKSSLANNCLLARRLVERGIRFVQLYDRGWDSLTHIENQYKRQCAAADRPVAALWRDLKQRGLLNNTLVIWGRTCPDTGCTGFRKNMGRNHHPHGFTMWMAGGGAKAGLTHGATDDFGYHVANEGVHVRDLHTNILRLMGIDLHRFKYPFKGLDLGLIGVEPARVVKELIA